MCTIYANDGTRLVQTVGRIALKLGSIMRTAPKDLFRVPYDYSLEWRSYAEMCTKHNPHTAFPYIWRVNNGVSWNTLKRPQSVYCER